MEADKVKALVTLAEDDVAPRFDLATEVLTAVVPPTGPLQKERTMVLPRASAEDLCRLILSEGVQVVICGGIEAEFYEYLTWKKIKVLDSIIGPWPRVLRELQLGRLEAGSVLCDLPEGNPYA
ncbi:MAG: dinitrogenase iron-molybdenum cofactor biosynthesis protein [Pseudomonadota bacterium]